MTIVTVLINPLIQNNVYIYIHVGDSRFIGHLTGKAADMRGSLTTLQFGYFNKKLIIKCSHSRSLDKTNRKQLSKVRN